MLGGMFVDHHGYGGTFLITAAVQTLAWSLYWFMLPLVPKTTAPVAKGSLQNPLLNSISGEEGEYNGGTSGSGGEGVIVDVKVKSG